MKYFSVLLSATVCSVLLSACGAKSISDPPSSTELAPMPNPELQLNQRVVQFNKLTGKERSFTALRVDANGVYSGESSNGCQWTTFGERVSPSLTLNGCGSSAQWLSGENRDMEKEGEIWPLQVGKTVSYRYELIDGNGKSHGVRVRNCEVDSQVSVNVTTGSMDAYKVICTTQEGDKLRTDSFCFSPELARVVKHVEQRTGESGPRRHNEYLRTQAAS